MMRTPMRAAALILALGLAACSQKGFETNLTVEPKPVPGVDWTQYSTWSFGRQGEYVLTDNAVLDDPAFRKSVGENTVSEMKKLGYEHVNGDPSMLLMFHVMVDERYDEVKLNPEYANFDMAWATESEDDRWREGTLMLFAIDAKTGKQIWGSTAQAELDKDSNFDTKKKRFNEVVTRMLADFPRRTAP